VRCSTSTATPAADGTERVMLQVEVHDTGIGISEADLERLFQPFTQVDSSNTRRFGGTGLGLAISARLASDMGGEINVKSEMGTGSTFFVDIPFGVVASESATGPVPTPDRPAVHPAPVATNRGPLLIVEDNVVNQLLVKEMAGHLGYRCDIAANGAEALALLAMREYAAVVMDCFMPEMDGFTATVELRRREGSERHTPVIAVTVGSRAQDRARCMAAGMDDYLIKPINEPELASVLSQWVDAQPARSSI
jgi:CheY-like chemotaxis protein